MDERNMGGRDISLNIPFDIVLSLLIFHISKKKLNQCEEKTLNRKKNLRCPHLFQMNIAPP